MAGNRLRAQDWSGFAALVTTALCLVEFARGNAGSAVGWLAATALLGVLTRYWSVANPSPMPHSIGWVLRFPRGGHSPDHLKRILDLRASERVLEIGPGIGIHSIPVAAALAPDGTLDVLDIQQEMLDEVTQAAARAGVSNITPTLCEAHELPYDDGAFDAAYMIGVLGEIPDGDATLRELRRVLKPDGRLVVGEVWYDPDVVWLGSLTQRAEQAGFTFERKLGNRLTYLASFRVD